MKTVDEILHYVSNELKIPIKPGERSIYANAIDLMLKKLDENEMVLLPVLVSFARDVEQKGFIKTPFVLFTSRKRIYYSSIHEPCVLNCENDMQIVHESPDITRLQVDRLVLEIKEPVARIVVPRMIEYMKSVGNEDFENYEQEEVKRLTQKQARLLEESATIAREYEERRQKEKEYQIWADLQKNNRLKRKFEYKVLSQDDAWFSSHVNTNKLEYALNRYAAEGWRVVGCVSGDIYGMVMGQKNQTVIILEREK